MAGLIIFFAVVGFLVLVLIGIYNSLVRSKIQVENAWAQN
jgi:LemA family.